MILTAATRKARAALSAEHRAAWFRKRRYASRGDREAVARLMALRGQAREGDPPIAVHPRRMGGHPAILRPGTSDATVVFDTFVGAYHLPPVESEPVRVIADLGANIGLTAADLASRYPAARVIAVELDRSLASLAAAHVQPWANRVQVVAGAVWHEDGSVNYIIEHGEEFGAHVTTSASQTAPAYSLDTLLAPFELVDFVKMDLEGAEREVLTAATKGGWAAKVRTIKVEVHAPWALQPCETELRRLGFAVRRDSRHWAAVIGVR